MNHKLLYIASVGHSGSTLLDMMLGNHKEVFSSGELIHLPNQFYRTNYFEPLPSNGILCSCRKGFNDCYFWSNVSRDLKKETGFDIRLNPLKFKIGILMRHQIPHQTTYYKILRKLYFISLKFHFCFDKMIYNYYNETNKNNFLLYKSIAKSSGKSVIVDSSKDLIRMNMLNRIYKNDFYIIVLLRNIKQVAASSKSRKGDPLKTAKHWINYYSRLLRIMSKKKINYIVVYFDDFIENPLVQLNYIYNFVGISNLNSFHQPLNSNNYHLIAGNKIRYSGKFYIEKNMANISLLSREEIKKINELEYKSKALINKFNAFK